MEAILPNRYDDLTEINRKINALALEFPDLCHPFDLPHHTIEHRVVRGLRVGVGRGDALLITGNMHARELAGTEFCLYLAYNLAAAYTAGESLVLGGKTITRERVRSLIENLTLILVPCVNPDGRQHVFDGWFEGDYDKILWRGNRNIWVGYPPSERRPCNGVDLNRNQAFLWDHLLHFAPGEGVQVTHLQCAPEQFFRGMSATSEQEAKNLVWLMDTFPNIKAYLDIHASWGAIVHPWGDDHIQSEDPNMNFRNPAYDGQRGPRTGSYDEYMPAADLRRFQDLAGSFRDGLQEARGVVYGIMPSVELAPDYFNAGGVSYPIYKPTSGCTDDYAYSRHFVNPSLSKIYAFTVEYGTPPDFTNDDTLATSFQPLGLEQALITRDLIAGTLEFYNRLRPGIDLSGCLPMLLLLGGAAGTIVTLLAVWVF